jgi:hypothetical protein
MTEQEKVILQSIDPKFKYIARDKDGTLCAYTVEPERSGGIWFSWTNDYGGLGAFDHLFENVKWEDEEPTLIQDLLNPKPTEENLINKTMVYKLEYWWKLLQMDNINSKKIVREEIKKVLENYKEVKE